MMGRVRPFKHNGEEFKQRLNSVLINGLLPQLTYIAVLEADYASTSYAHGNIQKSMKIGYP
ncbi:hypothetical protein EOE69_15900 [Vibrio cholerae]|nr:hypothetical protein [Vibrio cholerae]EGR2139126.1 hypothetical protein [Vibrio cholerae]PAS13582.1 hypothetical protein CGT76_06285 [Vibrio cholerae]